MARNYQRTNPLLGHVQCLEQCGGRAEIYQTKRAGRHFYTDCPNCGQNAGTGEHRQQLIWDRGQFIDGVIVVRPSNVTDSKQAAPVAEIRPEPAEGVGGWSPEDEEDQEEIEEEAEEGGRGGLVAMCVVTLAALGGAVWMK